MNEDISLLILPIHQFRALGDYNSAVFERNKITDKNGREVREHKPNPGI